MSQAKPYRSIGLDVGGVRDRAVPPQPAVLDRHVHAPLVPSYYRATRERCWTPSSWAPVLTGWRPPLLLARAGHRVVVYEGAAALGGGCRTAELTLPGYRHDVCSAVHPLVLASPFFQQRRPGRPGGQDAHPACSFCPPAGRRPGRRRPGAVEDTASALGPDAKAYRQLFGPLVPGIRKAIPTILGPLRSAPAHPWLWPGWLFPGCSRRRGWPACSKPKRRERWWPAPPPTRC